MKKVVMDCDPGIDDSLALILALKSGQLDVRALTAVTGNLTADRALENIHRVLDLIEIPDMPTSRGLLSPLAGEYPRDPFSHGEDGLGDVGLSSSRRQASPLSAPELLIHAIHEHAGELTVITTGPLTNLALAVMQQPDIVDQVVDVILIGGSYGFNRYGYQRATGGNPSSEWNVFVDPEAARVVFHTDLNIKAIGLDVAAHPQLRFSETHRQQLRQAGKPETDYALGLIKFVEGRGFETYTLLIDSLAVAAALDPSLIDFREIYVDVALEGELTRGQTVVDHRHRFQDQDLPHISAAEGARFDVICDLVVEVLCR